MISRWLSAALAVAAQAACVDAELGRSSLEIRAGELETGSSATVALSSDRLGGFFCTGALIGPDTVVTAAHCVDAIGQGPVEVLFTDDVNAPSTRRLEGIAWATDPRWSGDHDQGHDVGLVRLASPTLVEPLTFDASSAPVTEAEALRLFGFGADPTSPDHFGRKQSALLEARFVTERLVAFDSTGDAQICDGDSGGPLVREQGSEGDALVAVASFSDQICSGSSGASLLGPSADFIQSWLSSGGEQPPTRCTHDVCSQGGALASGCDPCVDQVCALDPFCCETRWDRACADRAALQCPRSCGGKSDEPAGVGEGGCQAGTSGAAPGALLSLLTFLGLCRRRRSGPKVARMRC